MPFNSPFNAIRNQQRWDQTTLVESQSVDATSGTIAIGQFFFATNVFPPQTQFRFEGVWWVSSGALTGLVQLYNVTDGEIVASSATSTSSTSPTAFAQNLTVGSGAGEFKPTVKTYEVRISVTGALPTDILNLGSARLLKV